MHLHTYTPSPFTHPTLNFQKTITMRVETLIPRWLEVLMEEKFFEPCLVHELDRKNEKNILCLDCCIAFCPHCLSPHSSHRLLRIRRYVYNEVIRMEDAEKLIDCSSVQSYINNGAKVLFINQRPQTRPFRAAGNVCTTCNRCLQHPFIYCSLSCKVMYLLETEGGVSDYLLDCNYLPLSGSSELEDGQMTPDSVLQPARTSSCSTGVGGGLVEWFRAVGMGFGEAAGNTEVVKKKRSSLSAGRTGSGPVCLPVVVADSPASGLMNRRKKSCTPHRSPLY